jgi:two-component sensor histidine kinase
VLYEHCPNPLFTTVKTHDAGIMLKVFIVIPALLFSVQSLIAQEEPTHTISELNTLLQKTRADSARANLLLETSLVYIWKQGMEKNDFDSALIFANRAMNIAATLDNPALKGRGFTMYSQLYREGNQKERGRSYADSAMAVFTKHNLKEGLANANMELGSYYNIYSNSEWEQKIKYTEEAQRLYGACGNKMKQAGVLKHLGDFYQIRKMDSLALNRLYEALAIYKSLQYEEVQGVYDLMGFVFFGRADYHQALKYGLLAVQTAERFKITGQELSTIYNRVGLTYYRLMQYRSAADYCSQAFSIALKNKDTSNARIIAPNTIDAFLRLESQKEMLNFLHTTRFMYEKENLRFKEIYLASYILAYLLTNDYKKAEPFVGELHRLVSDTSTRNRRILYRAVIPYYLAAGQYKKMYKYLPANEEFCKQTKLISGLTDNYLWWYKADSALGNQTDAITHYKLYKEASDSSLRMTARQQTNQLLIQHETYKKDQEIAAQESNILLLTSQAKMQRQQLRQTRLVRNLTYGLAALLLIVAALLFNRYRLKQRSNKKLQHQQQEINDKNIALQKVVHQKEKLLVEKEWLMKEVHHRTKNNMHIVMSLLNLQSAYIDNEMALSAIQECELRLHAMSLIHQKLYNTENVSSIDMSVYIHELVSHLADSFNTGQRIRFELSIESVEMDVSQAIPLGLILNEAVTNSIKYAFPGNRNGVISVSLTNTSRQDHLLVISDNGVGMSTHLPDKKPGSLGMSLITGLSEDLQGDFSIENNNGTTIKISFVKHTIVKQSETAVKTQMEV